MNTNALNYPVVQKLFTLVVNPVVELLFAAAAFYFIWGVFKYIRNSDDPSGREEGGKHILYGIIGLFIMFSVWGIIQVVRSTLGVH
ncbi:MAG: hypothetical protein KGI79_00885 [Patescibacteria group bacterium]|nr:hypothetical protein [Patescibacteria group bacterium]MDE2116418.1 hypothetical protein [Patescibacteria group bacterium]